MANEAERIRKPREHAEQLENYSDAKLLQHHAVVVPSALDNHISEGRYRIHEMLT